MKELDNTIYYDILKSIKLAMKQQNIEQKVLAIHFGVTKSTVSRWLSEKNIKPMPGDVLCALLEFLSTDCKVDLFKNHIEFNLR